MAIFAQLNGDTVINVIAADSKTKAEKALACVLIELKDGLDAGIGWTWDGETFTASEVIVDEAEVI